MFERNLIPSLRSLSFLLVHLPDQRSFFIPRGAIVPEKVIGNAIRSGKPYGFALLIFTTAPSSEGEVHGEARLCSKVIPGAPDYLDGKVNGKRRSTVYTRIVFRANIFSSSMIDQPRFYVHVGFSPGRFREGGSTVGPLSFFLSHILSSLIAIKASDRREDYHLGEAFIIFQIKLFLLLQKS